MSCQQIHELRRKEYIPWKMQFAKTDTRWQNRNRIVSIKEMELILKKSSTKKLGPVDFTSKFYQIFKR